MNNHIGDNTNCTSKQFLQIIKLCKKYYKKTGETTIDFVDSNIVFVFCNYGQLTTKTLREIEFDENYNWLSLGSSNGGAELFKNSSIYCFAIFDEIINELEKIISSS